MPLRFVPLTEEVYKNSEHVEYCSETGLIKVRDHEGRTYILKQILQYTPQEIVGIDIYGNLIKIRIAPREER